MHVIETFFPNWKELTIHESSPANRGASVRLSGQCKNYIGSQYFPHKNPSPLIGAVRYENLEALTFPDESIDLHVTQDVMEHVFDPSKVFREIARTLKPGGAHVFTVPLVNTDKPSKRRARRSENGQIEHIEPAKHHINPISNEGSLVTIDWGYDICTHIFHACRLFTQMVYIDDLSKGIRANYIEVMVTMKPTPQINAPL